MKTDNSALNAANRNTQRDKTKRLVLTAAFAALAYVAVVVCRVPITSVEFLKYEPKDIIITVAGFLFGIPSAAGISIAVSLIEMVTISTTGIWGFLMNVISTMAFALPAAALFRRFRNVGAEIVGLILGMVASVGMMILWNWLITPFYMGVPREAVVSMLVPVFLPFNLIKCGINAAITLILHRVTVRIERML